jgi:hypothetical protein
MTQSLRAAVLTDVGVGSTQWLLSASYTQAQIDLDVVGFIANAVNQGMRASDQIVLTSTIDGSISLRQALAFTATGAATISQISGAVGETVLTTVNNDVDPTNGVGLLPAFQAWHFSSSGLNVTVTGIAGGIDGLVLLLENGDSTGSVTFTSNDVRSAAGNRLQSAFVLAPGQMQWLTFSGTQDAWVLGPTLI